MTICDLCESIPIHNLPELDTDWTLHGGSEKLGDFFSDLKQQRDKDNPIGFRHQLTLESLEGSSSNGCVLCSLLLSAVYEIRSNYHEAFQDALWA